MTTAWSRKNPLGERKKINGARRPSRKMRTIQQRLLHLNNTAIIITGDIASAKAFVLAKAIFGTWNRADPESTTLIPLIPRLHTTPRSSSNSRSGQIVVMLQWQGPSAFARIRRRRTRRTCPGRA